MNSLDYQEFLKTPSRSHWERIGLRRRAGVAAPLFSLYSSQSVGTGEIPDLELLIDWCAVTGLSILQLLPMNDVGFDFRPYDAQSSFALEPVYLALEKLSGGGADRYARELLLLKKKFPAGQSLIDYGVKRGKLDLLWKIFTGSKARPAGLEAFRKKNSFWLEDYALYKVLKEKFVQQAWWDWPPEFKHRKREALEKIKQSERAKIEFHEWLQYELFLQGEAVKRRAQKKGVLLMGDLPFLVSGDSADVWSHPQYFKLDFASGAPPDLTFAKGQRWGMPPYDWERLAADGYAYWKEKIGTAGNFYDLFRIDHFVGLFRIWTVPQTERLENLGLTGRFDPSDEGVWEERGRKIVSMMLGASKMLPCAEDLGTVPECSYRVLRESGLPGMEVQRWARDWGNTYDFSPPGAYRKNSIATLATHDMSGLRGWLEYEIGTLEAGLFERQCGFLGLPAEKLKEKLFDPKTSRFERLRWRREVDSVEKLLTLLGLDLDRGRPFVEWYRGSFDERDKFLAALGLEWGKADLFKAAQKAVEKVNETASIFSIPLLQDWLAADPKIEYDPWNFRINFPGPGRETNWRSVLPLSLEQLNRWKMNDWIKETLKNTNRL